MPFCARTTLESGGQDGREFHFLKLVAILRNLFCRQFVRNVHHGALKITETKKVRLIILGMVDPSVFSVPPWCYSSLVQILELAEFERSFDLLVRTSSLIGVHLCESLRTNIVRTCTWPFWSC